MSKIFTIIFLFFPCLSNCQNFYFKPKYSIAFDSSKGDALMHQCGSRAMPKKISDYWNLRQTDIKLLENNFKKVQKLKSDQCCNKGFKVSNLKKYGFQYVGVLIDNKKYIYLNVFPVAEFATKPVSVCDGGLSYWGVLFSIDNLNFSQLAFNGPPIKTLKNITKR